MISDLCDFEGMDQYSNVIDLLVEYTLFLEDTKMTKDEPDPDDPDGLNAHEQKRRRLLGRTVRLWKQKFQSLEYTVRAVHECEFLGCHGKVGYVFLMAVVSMLPHAEF